MTTYDVFKVTDGLSREMFLRNLFTDKENGREREAMREAMQELLEMSDAANASYAETHLDELYDKMNKLYRKSGIARESEIEEMFSGKHTLESFYNEVGKMCFCFMYPDFTSSIGIANLNDDVLRLVELGNALKEKNFSDEQVLDIEKGLFKLNNGFDVEDGMLFYNPVEEIEKAIGNEKDAEKFTAALENGELDPAAYAKNRLALLHKFVNSDEQTLESFLPLFVPALKKPVIEEKVIEEKPAKKFVDINVVDEDLKAEQEAFRKNLAQLSEKEANARKAYEEAENALAAAENLLQKRKNVISKEERQFFSDEAGRHQTKWSQDAEVSLRVNMSDAYRKALEKNTAFLQDLEGMANDAHPEVFGADYRRKLTKFRQKTEGLTVAYEIPNLAAAAVEVFDQNAQYLDRVTAAAAEKVQKAEQALKNGLAEAQREQAEILKQQEELQQADISMGVTQQQAMKQQELQERQNLLAERTKALQDALALELKKYNAVMSSATTRLDDAKQDALNSFNKQEMNKFVQTVRTNQESHAAPLEKNLREMQHYREQLRMETNAEPNRNELETVFNSIRDTKPGRRTLWLREKDDTLFRNLKTEMTNYMQNHDAGSAEKAYEACRIFLASRMKPDKTLKKGNEHENIRAQGVVRMLELMEKLPEFQSCLDNEPEKQEEKNKAPEGWEIMDSNVSGGYNKLNFEQLENSLAEHSSEKHSGKQYTGSAKNNKAFTNLNKRIGKKKAEEKTAQEKAAAKAAKENAKKAKKTKAKAK